MAYDTCLKRSAYIKNAFDQGTENLACALCGATHQELLVSNEEVRVVMCKLCSLAYIAPRLSREGYTRFYREYFQDSRRSLETLDDAIQRLVCKDAYKKKLPIVNAFRGAISAGDIGVEIGGGWGTFAKLLQDEVGCSVEVVEPSPLAARVAREYYGLTVYAKDGETFMQDRIGVQKYDFAILIHVFEHLTDPNKFLEQIKKILKPNGQLFLALPNLSSPDGPSDKFFHIEHCYYYTPKTLSMMLLKHGFVPYSVVQDKNDMKIIAAIKNEIGVQRDFRNNERLIIRLKIFLIDILYGFLHAMRQGAEIIFTRRFFIIVRDGAVRILKKSGIITGP